MIACTGAKDGQRATGVYKFVSSMRDFLTRVHMMALLGSDIYQETHQNSSTSLLLSIDVNANYRHYDTSFEMPSKKPPS